MKSTRILAELLVVFNICLPSLAKGVLKRAPGQSAMVRRCAFKLPLRANHSTPSEKDQFYTLIRVLIWILSHKNDKIMISKSND